jgi:LuxR family transcriptional regulator, maltose regulon positive regulatory protein
MLDQCDARVILLLAPAGYGKTTLARQWAKTLSGAIWVSLTPAHRDVVTFAEDVAAGIDALGGDASKFIGEYVRARSNPQRAARDIGRALTKHLESTHAQWLVIDDYQELGDASEVEELISVLQERLAIRFLVASRLRPGWATARRLIYREVFEIGRDELAMTLDECRPLISRRPQLAEIARLSKGWPAVVSLAMAVDIPSPPRTTLPAALHKYLADELFHTAPPALRSDLLSMSLLADLSRSSLGMRFGSRASDVIDAAREQGFVAESDAPELHPLLREFLLEKLLDEPDAEARIRDAVAVSLRSQHWDRAAELVLRFNLLDLVEPTLEAAFKPLVRSGRLATLSTFARHASSAPTFPPPAVNVVEAELAQRDGQHQLAIDIAQRVRIQLPRDHVLKSRADGIIGHSSFLLAKFEQAEGAFTRAFESASDERDETEALHGLALAKIFGERPGAAMALEALAERRHRSPTDLVRYATADIAWQRYSQGLNHLRTQEALLALPLVDDPRARTAFTYAVASALAQRTDYEDAQAWLDQFSEDAEAFGLEFTLPYALWTAAQVSLGRRRFAATERSLQQLEDIAEHRGDEHHKLNANILRARLLLQTGKPDDAIDAVRVEPPGPVIPSWRGEFLGTRALALSCVGHVADALEAATQAENATTSCEVHALTNIARALNTFQTYPSAASDTVRAAAETGIWDPVVTALRAVPAFADAAAKEASSRPLLAQLYRRSNDMALARRAGLRSRGRGTPTQLLSPREVEVLGLIARGLRNREIAKALFIAESTTKVHVRHVFEKLGVRSRAEAVARYQIFGER